MRHIVPIDRDKRISSLSAEVSLIRTFQEVYDKTDPVGRKARQIRLRQIARQLRLMGETGAVSQVAATKAH